MYKEGEDVTSLFIILNGEFELTKMVENNQSHKKNLDMFHKDPLKAKRIAIAMTSKSLKSMVKKKSVRNHHFNLCLVVYRR